MYDSSSQDVVLLADHTLVPAYAGVAFRDGEAVGRRISAPEFDFAAPYVVCSGGFSGSVTCTFTLGANHPTNPFLHKYHPDHDNLDPRYENVAQEAYAIEREIAVEFGTRYPPDEDLTERVPPPGWGASMLGGTYTETLTGLHKTPIKVQGSFVLQRVSEADHLNE